jgi:lysophospholipase
MPTQLSTPETAFLSSDDGTKLFYEYLAPERPVGLVLMVHGFADHCGRYLAMAKDLASRGYGVLRFDYRGHGRSDGRRGHIFRFDEYLMDFDAAYSGLSERNPGSLPLFVMAHSYGGLITLHASRRHRFDGVVFSSPFYGFAIKIPAWKAFAGRLLSRYIPGLSMPTDIDPSIVSHDPATIDEYAIDPLIGRVATTRWLTETEAAHEDIPQLAAAFDVPVLFQQAGDDQLVDASAGRRAFDAFPSADKTWIEYPDQYHEIWFEMDRQPTLDAAFNWIETRSGA